ncbi:outer membrane receptor protein involved in Fe transport [Blastomonas natatoria]|uniref:Outer membrane receptor protein involved in Fe transport n=1 Tax=Blastomonas natatoria TaxID=34015 RepID=A0A2V3V6A8_9SPHN|nr:TonB-dependent receptor [Blastomonas natatoria]PXW76258.1 outer membrane receptor protein involved in Fe transport [Blastomonas natatoria]
MTHSFKACLLAVTALTSVSAMAQEAVPGAAAADSDVIIVTARKTEETLQEAPTTVSVVTAAAIDRLGLDNLTDIAKTVPGLVFDDTLGRDANRPVIRGQANILGQSGVAFFIDGIYYSGSLADYDVDTVERFEIVKGPQSALYGRNTYSGAINLISKMPSTTWTGRVQVDLAEDDRYEATANVRGPLAEGLGIVLGGRVLDNAGAFRNAFDGTRIGKQQSYSGYGALQFNNGGPFRASLRANYNVIDDGQPAIFAQSANANNCFPDNSALYRGQNRYFCGVIRPQQVNTDYRRQFVDPENVGLESKTLNAGLRLDFDFTDELTLTSLTGYNRRTANTKTDGDYSPNSFNMVIFAYGATGPAPAPIIPPRTTRFTAFATSVQDFSFSNRAVTDDWSQELRLAYEGDRLQLMLGGYYFDQSDVTRDTRVVPPGSLARAQSNSAAATASLCAQLPNCGIFTPIAVTAANLPESRNVNSFDIENKAIFGSATFDITDTLSFSAEGRYAEEKIRQSTLTFNNGQAIPAPRVVQATFKEFTPRFTLSWQATPDNLFYAVYAEGQKPGGFNSNQAIIAGFPTFQPEDNKTYEIGTKNTFFDGKLTANLALYHTEVTGYQITQNVSVPPNQVSLTRNGGDARINGAELELLIRPVRNFTVTANYSYVDAKFTAGTDENLGLINDLLDDRLANCSTGDEFPAVTGCQSRFGSIRGKRIPRAPEHTMFVDVDYRTPISDDWNFFVGSNVNMVSTSFDQVLNFAETGGSVVVDARLGVQSDRYRVMLYARNLFDEDSVAQILRYADANADLRRNFVAGLRPPRRIGILLTASF